MDYFKGKYTQGIFSDGQGPVKGQSISSERETKGLLDDLGYGKHIKMEKGGGSPPTPAGSEEKGFDLHSKAYAGPQNWVPDNKGVIQPFNVNKS